MTFRPLARVRAFGIPSGRRAFPGRVPDEVGLLGWLLGTARYLVPLALLVTLGAKVYWFPFVNWPFPRKAFDPALVHSSRELRVALAAFLAPIPLCLAAGLSVVRRRGGHDTVGILVAQLATLVVIELGVFFGLTACGLATARVATAALAEVFLVGLLVAGQAWRPGDLGPAGRSLKVYGFLASALLASGVASVHFGREGNLDLFNYHVANAHSFLHGREGLDFAVGDKESHFNPLLDAAHYLVMRAMRPVWVGFVVGAAHGVACLLVFGIAYEVVSRLDALGPYRGPLSAACAATAATDPHFLGQLGTSFHDNLLVSFVLAALLVALRTVGRATVRPGAACLASALAGGLIGAATGFKLTAAIYAVSIAVVTGLGAEGWRRKLGQTAGFVAGAMAGFLATNGFWMAHLDARFGSPVFPLYNSVFRSPYWPDADLDYLAFTSHFGWKDHLLLPFYLAENNRVLMEAFSRDARLAVGYALLILAVVGRLPELCRADWRSRERLGEVFRTPLTRVGLVVVAFAVGSYVVWYWKFRILRYLVPVKMLMPLVCVLLLFDLLRERRRVWVAASVLFALIAATVDVAYYGRRDWRGDYLAFEMSRPVTPAENGLVLTTWIGGAAGDTMPTGALTTVLPQSMRYIKLDSPQVLNPTGGKPLAMQEEVRRLIAAHTGPFFLLAPRSPVGVKWAEKMLDRYGLKIADGQSPVTFDNYCLEHGFWRVERRDQAGAIAGAPRNTIR
ncbi:MAG: hypothetical protein LC745_00150 [Planctomycetia bacterium]|nr:hypothetical protein [Planctomycetia bacterium]